MGISSNRNPWYLHSTAALDSVVISVTYHCKPPNIMPLLQTYLLCWHLRHFLMINRPCLHYLYEKSVPLNFRWFYVLFFLDYNFWQPKLKLYFRHRPIGWYPGSWPVHSRFRHLLIKSMLELMETLGITFHNFYLGKQRQKLPQHKQKVQCRTAFLSWKLFKYIDIPKQKQVQIFWKK